MNDTLMKYILENEKLDKVNRKLDYEVQDNQRNHTLEVRDLQKKIKDAEDRVKDLNLDIHCLQDKNGDMYNQLKAYYD